MISERILMTIPTKQSFLQFMQDKAYRPLSFKELTQQMQIPKEQRDLFKKLLKDLVKDGHVIKIRGERYGVPAKMNLISGELTCHPKGFGFVMPEEGGKDIFINPGNMKGAMHRDKVVARVEGRSKGNGKREGRIIRIVERVLQEIIIPPKEITNAKEGEIVEAEITRWPAEHMAPLGKIVAVLGDYEDPDVEIEVIVKKYGLLHKFPHNVITEAKEIPQMVAEEDIAGRIDLRNKNTVTIDGETAKDFDDAVS